MSKTENIFVKIQTPLAQEDERVMAIEKQRNKGNVTPGTLENKAMGIGRFCGGVSVRLQTESCYGR